MRWMVSLAALFTAIILSGLVPPQAQALNANHQCAYCHSLHDAPGFSLLNQSNAANLELTAEVVCLNCHGPGGIAATVDVHRNGVPTDQPAFRHSCLACHDAHDNQFNSLGRKNIRLVSPQVQTPNSGVYNVSFESRGTDAGEPALHSFADGDATYDGICEACHTLTTRHRNNPSGNHGHQAGTTCTSCHTHANGFNRN